MIRALKIFAGTLVVLALLTVLAVAALLTWPRPAAEYLASRLLERRVSVSALDLHWQDTTIRVALRDLLVANMQGGSSPDMIAIAALDATIDRAALFDGRLVYRRLQAERARIALERDATGRGNWEFGSTADAAPSDSANRLVLVPKNRKQMPTLLDFRLAQGELRIRTSSGKWLRLPLDDLAIQSTDDNAPVSISFDGGYNDTDAQLSGTTGSFNAFRDASKPFDAAFTIITPGTKLDFRGVIGQPLDFDTVQGRLGLEARRLDDLVGIFDTPPGIAAPLKLSGGFTRDGDAWRLENAVGDIGGNIFEGRIALDEAPRGEADALQFHLDFNRLDLVGLLPQGSGGAKSSEDWRSLKLRPATAPDTPHLDIQLSAETLVYDAHQLHKVAAAVEAEAGHIRLHGATAVMGDGHLALNGHLAAGDGKDDFTLQGALKLDHAKADRLLLALGQGQSPGAEIELLAGSLDGRADLALRGVTLGAAAKTARGHGVVAMQQGRVARKLIEAASADLRAAFRSPASDTALRCLLGVAVIRNGVATLSPLVLSSDGGTIRGAGQIDLGQQTVDLVLRSDPKTTGLFALDIPLHVQGPLADAAVKPERSTVLPAQAAAALPPEAAALVRGNPCAG